MTAKLISNKPGGPVTLTILPTYRCTAECQQCCFGSNPRLQDRLSLDEIKDAITQGKKAFTSLKQVVFSGGECVMIGDDLFRGLSHAKHLGLQTRIVTNGYWGASPKKAAKIAEKLRESGLKEVNISTGRDHAKFVSIDAVLTAMCAVVKEGIFGLITIEQDADDSSVVNQIKIDPRFIELSKLGNEKFRFQINSWMKFNEHHKERIINKAYVKQENPCNQLFSNIVVTPYNSISACCGLTFEHIPEMHIGKMGPSALKTAFENESNDFVKIWIHMDGPDGVVRKIYDDNPPDHLISSDHMCDTCVRLHKCDTTRNLLRERYQEFLPEVMLRYEMKKFINDKILIENSAN